MRLAFLILLAGCIPDGHGFYGTRWMVAQWMKADHDGSLACVDVVDNHTISLHRFGVLCRFDEKRTFCVCSIHDEPLFFKPIGYQVPVLVFEPTASERLSPGVTWPPGLEARRTRLRDAHDGVRQIEAELRRGGL